MLWPGSPGLQSVNAPKEHRLDSVEGYVVLILVLFHSWKPFFPPFLHFLDNRVPLRTAFQQIKTWMSICRRGCRNCSMRHQNPLILRDVSSGDISAEAV